MQNPEEIYEQGTQITKNATNANWPGIRVLVVDGNENDQQFLEKKFLEHDIYAVPAPDMKTAHAVIEGMEPHFIILDIHGVESFDKVINGYGNKVILYSGLYPMLPDRVKTMVLACYDKNQTDEMIQFILNKAKAESKETA